MSAVISTFNTNYQLRLSSSDDNTNLNTTNAVEAQSCLSCQHHLDTCLSVHTPHLASLPPSRNPVCALNAAHPDYPSCFSSPSLFPLPIPSLFSTSSSPSQSESNFEAKITCSLKLCEQGPPECRVGGSCERRVCRDIAGYGGEPVCRACVREWVGCVRGECLRGGQGEGEESEEEGVDGECRRRCWEGIGGMCGIGGVCERRW